MDETTEPPGGGQHPTAHPLIGVGAVVLGGDEVLLVRRRHPPRQGEWSLPGGRQEWGETVADTLCREVREETGLVVRVLGLIDVVDLIERDGTTGRVERHYTLIDLLAEPVGGTARAGSDASEVGWFALDRLPALWSETRRVITLGNRLRQAGALR